MAKISFNINDDLKQKISYASKQQKITQTEFMLSLLQNYFAEDTKIEQHLTNILHDEYCMKLIEELGKFYSEKYISNIFVLTNEQAKSICALNSFSTYSKSKYILYKNAILAILIKPEHYIQKYIEIAKKPINYFDELAKYREANTNYTDTEYAEFMANTNVLYTKYKEAIAYTNWLKTL